MHIAVLPIVLLLSSFWSQLGNAADDPFERDGRLMLSAIQNNNINQVKILLKRGYVDPNGFINSSGKYSFVMVARGHPEILKMLIDAGANQNDSEAFFSGECIICEVNLRSDRDKNMESYKILSEARFFPQDKHKLRVLTSLLSEKHNKFISLDDVVRLWDYLKRADFSSKNYVSQWWTFINLLVENPELWEASVDFVNFDLPSSHGSMPLNGVIASQCLFYNNGEIECPPDNINRLNFIKFVLGRSKNAQEIVFHRDQWGYSGFDYVFTSPNLRVGNNITPLQKQIHDYLVERFPNRTSNWKLPGDPTCRPWAHVSLCTNVRPDG